MRRIAGLGILALALAASPAAGRERMAVGVTVSYDRPVELDRIAELGFRYLRTDLAWSQVEPAPGVYRFEPYDALVQSLQARGMGAVLATMQRDIVSLDGAYAYGHDGVRDYSTRQWATIDSRGEPVG